MNRIIPIFFSTDDNYLPFLSVALSSLMKNASPDYRYRVHILNAGLNPQAFGRILDMADEKTEIVPVDVREKLSRVAAKLSLRDYYTVSIYYRLFIASMFPQYEKAIYLDADVVVCGDISRLYQKDLGGKTVGAVSDDVIAGHRDFRDYAENAVGVPYRRYFNSGVLLMDLSRFRRTDVEGRFLNLLGTYCFETICPDQDYLNVLCRDDVCYLGRGWNKMSLDTDYPGLPDLIHYNMFYKPWQYSGICYGEYFWKYAADCPFYQEILGIRRGFGAEGRAAHRKANRILHRRAREITSSENNFCRMLMPGQILSGCAGEVSYEA